MKVILFEDVPGWGEEGDIIEVKRGYARNYLLPRGLAVICTKASLAVLKERQKAIEKRSQTKKKSKRWICRSKFLSVKTVNFTVLSETRFWRTSC